ncbi:piggyBac transposable element-derived protein 4-like [Schistocerca americana]|uniref:piggyBac transposable element-derived protein 4-like n=1 Tax=Schistocerca americana TaxID=7009 RepID=UPI001F4FC783|nr:piggyBac transposable element-derived protein 4-like [Schistocerca americana]
MTLMMMWTMFKKKFLAVQVKNSDNKTDSKEESRCPRTSVASNPVDIVPEERARLTARGKPRPARRTDSEEGERSDTVTLVKTLLANLSGKGYTLFTDRFYTSPILASELEAAKTALVGTTRKSRQGLLRPIKDTNLQRGELIFRRKGNMLALCWKDKRNVHMISTRHTAEMVTFTDQKGREKSKPACVVDYNKNKFGVDLSDQRLSYGAFEHRTVKWWRKLELHVILMVIVNSCILYNKVTGKHLTTSHFMTVICADLAQSKYLKPRPSPSGLSRLSTGNHFLEKIETEVGKKKKQKQCVVCYLRGKKLTGKVWRKDTSYQCSECKVALCKMPCFKIYHTKSKIAS